MCLKITSLSFSSRNPELDTVSSQKCKFDNTGYFSNSELQLTEINF